MLAKLLRQSLPLLVVVLGMLLQSPVKAQFEPQRARVDLTQMPSLNREVWPADFNEDGVTDLVALQAQDVVILIGRGDGTFGPPSVVTTGAGVPVGVGDINGDGFADVVTMVVNADTTTSGLLFAGNGNGTFSGPAALPFRVGTPTYIVDMNKDGFADIVTTTTVNPAAPPAGGRILIYPGHGDFTFEPAIALVTNGNLMAIAPTDLTGDGMIDVATLTVFTPEIYIFENQGAFAFTVRTIPLDHHGAGLAARDLNGDGIVDLVAGMGLWDTTWWRDGFLYVLLGTGGGAFGPPVRYPTNLGPVAVVTGDFNGDSIPDIATGNRSAILACELGTHLWDSISILPGRGDGTFGPTKSFALGDSEVAPDTAYVRSLHRLNTSDLNADGRTDLIASPGAVLLSLPPGENSAPGVFAGVDLVEPWDPLSFPQLRGSATDPDSDWLTFEWKDDLGNTLGNIPRQCLKGDYGAGVTRTFTLTVDDGLGGVSTDAMQWTFTGFTTPPLPIPDTFSSADIGSVGTTGFDGFQSGVFRVSGSGADIWGTVDAFRFVHTPVSGSFDVVTRVTSVENIDPWTKAGLMVRESLSAGSRHAFLSATPTSTNGIAFQRREVSNGVTVHSYGPAAAPPMWLRLVRDGDVITAYTRASTADPWALVDTQTLPGLTDPVFVGMAVTSHREGTLATAFFSNFSINGAPLPPPATLPQGWESADVGSVGVPGNAVFDGLGFRVDGSGADIWQTTDAFHYAYTRLPGDGSALVRVYGVQGLDEWAKAGLMIRESLSPSAAHHFLLTSGAHGTAYQRRPSTGQVTLHTTLPVAAAWYRIERTGGTIRLSYSSEFAPTAWQPIAVSPFPTGEVLIGLAVTSHANGQLARGTFSNAQITLGGTSLPPPTWSNDVVGPVAITGASAFDGTTHTLSTSGIDIWGTMDSFRFTHQTLAGDGSVVARVASLAGPDPWSKAGVMIRSSLDPSAAHAFMLVSRDNGLAFQRRTAAGSLTTHTYGPFAGAPMWVKLTRAGEVITAAVSSDGVTWEDVGSDTLAIGTGPVLFGLALTSHDNTALATATFDQVAALVE